MQTRKETDSIGELEVEENAYYGVQTLRGYQNFQITGERMNGAFIRNITKIKKAGATINARYGYIKPEIAQAIITACDEILDGKFDDHFITDAVQGGAGTSVNMNVNEVVANRATELLGGRKGEYLCRPNDHVNRSQSTNDVIPTAGKLTVLELSDGLFTELEKLIVAFENKAKEFDGVIKMGRTQLQDAVPVRLGQEFHAYATGLKRDYKRLKNTLQEMQVVNLGGSAIGTSVNVGAGYLQNIVAELSKECNRELTQADDLIDGTGNLDGFVAVSGSLKALAVNVSKICNDLRLMSSGPKTGFAEIILPAKQNGSSIMPGKINPVIPEVVSQVAFMVVGNDMTVTVAAEAGQLELNAFEPVIFYRLFESITCLTNAMRTLTLNCIEGITANKERCEELVYSSVGVVTALCPYLGYKKSAELAKEALKRKRSIKDLVLEYGLMEEKELDVILDPYAMTENNKK
ncbi:MAG: aspartate ammonia-lyase [Clostridia bacterium]|nr:aspartate ammonia-lyase [Clostridia bacterium]